MQQREQLQSPGIIDLPNLQTLVTSPLDRNRKTSGECSRDIRILQLLCEQLFSSFRKSSPHQFPLRFHPPAVARGLQHLHQLLILRFPKVRQWRDSESSHLAPRDELTTLVRPFRFTYRDTTCSHSRNPIPRSEMPIPLFDTPTLRPHLHNVTHIRPRPVKRRPLPTRTINATHPIHIRISRTGHLDEGLRLARLFKRRAFRLHLMMPKRSTAPVASKRRIVPLAKPRLINVNRTTPTAAAIIG